MKRIGLGLLAVLAILLAPVIAGDIAKHPQLGGHAYATNVLNPFRFGATCTAPGAALSARPTSGELALVEANPSTIPYYSNLAAMVLTEYAHNYAEDSGSSWIHGEPTVNESYCNPTYAGCIVQNLLGGDETLTDDASMQYTLYLRYWEAPSSLTTEFYYGNNTTTGFKMNQVINFDGTYYEIVSGSSASYLSNGGNIAPTSLNDDYHLLINYNPGGTQKTYMRWTSNTGASFVGLSNISMLDGTNHTSNTTFTTPAEGSRKWNIGTVGHSSSDDSRAHLVMLWDTSGWNIWNSSTFSNVWQFFRYKCSEYEP